MMDNSNSTLPIEEDRVERALAEKGKYLLHTLAQYHLSPTDIQILILAFKQEGKLDIYAKSSSDNRYRVIQTYTICAKSGVLGPKKAEGDKQVPEGFYHINRFNPKSKYYLSLGLNYPNNYDRAHDYTGSDIFIHGKCETKGCLPMTDECMKEIYLYALWAKQAGQANIPVYIFPFEMTPENMVQYKSQTDGQTYAFWENIRKGYQIFQDSKKEVSFTVSEHNYVFTS